jgi:hypothetical protein
MRYAIQEEPGALAVTVEPDTSICVALTILAVVFLAFAGTLVWLGRPATEVFHCQREGPGVRCARRSLLLGRGTTDTQERLFTAAARCEVESSTDDNNVASYEASIVEKPVWLAIGSDSGRAWPEAIAAQANAFLGDPSVPSWEVRYEVWRWFMLPIGGLFVIFALVSLGGAFAIQRWSFRRTDAVAERRSRLRTRPWPLARVRECVARTFPKGEDEHYLLALQLDGDRTIRLADDVKDSDWEQAQAVAQAINRFLKPG